MGVYDKGDKLTDLFEGPFGKIGYNYGAYKGGCKGEHEAVYRPFGLSLPYKEEGEKKRQRDDNIPDEGEGRLISPEVAYDQKDNKNEKDRDAEHDEELHLLPYFERCVLIGREKPVTDRMSVHEICLVDKCSTLKSDDQVIFLFKLGPRNYPLTCPI
jgi:hypothetical protein